MSYPRPTTASGLSWGVKRTFRRYIQGDPSGSVWPTGGAEFDERAFMATWPLVDHRDGPSDGFTLFFQGRIRFTAHFGMLDLALTDPTLELAPSRGTGPRTAAIRVSGVAEPILKLRPERVERTDLREVWVASEANLTPSGSALFGGSYPPGQPMDPLIFVIAAPHE